MTKNVTIELFCDFCQKDLKFTNYEHECRLALKNESKDFPGGIMYGCSVPNSLKTNKHFCNLTCLCKWAQGNLKENKHGVVYETKLEESV